jgi:hypothetical protein
MEGTDWAGNGEKSEAEESVTKRDLFCARHVIVKHGIVSMLGNCGWDGMPVRRLWISEATQIFST